MIENVPEPHRLDTGAGAASSSPDEIERLRIELASVRRQLTKYERERAEAVEREKLLRAELQHRVRNMLAVIRSIFSRTIESGHSSADVADHFRGRLDALARFQVARGVNPLGPSYLEDIVRDEFQSFEFDERIEIEGEDVAIPNDVAQALGLAIHELATNAVKFGALSTPDKRTRLNVRWHTADGDLVVEWLESGVAVLASVPVRRGFGREFIEHALPYQVAASTRFDLLPGGISCRIAIPLQARPEPNPSIRNWF
ncbi:sensor histidine kinase [Sphingomonas radiodurans]|uniref:sensor histidine kinase n=1 Tax=Sphingomonas radiodurans TaxID=2890321 RepID=UPI001E61A00E|nr:sensor histidine kinase [Sphingomonas radiodurans]WBH18134.1 sensor histidine kinase [Sphingomonas radiodurans]